MTHSLYLDILVGILSFHAFLIGTGISSVKIIQNIPRRPCIIYCI
jgi:hypothetical protein